MNKKLFELFYVFKQNLKLQKLQVNINKVFNKFISLPNFIQNKKNIEWIKNEYISIEEYAKKIDEVIWSETLAYFNNFEKKSKEIMSRIDFKLGGGGAYHLLYFLTRKYSLSNIIETGVASGFTSAAILEALRKNKNGLLFSSDYPYPKIPNCEKYIGILVNEELRKNWLLHIEGDEFNLNKIPINWVGKVDLFHYDSSKWFRDKKRTLKIISKYLSKNAFIVFDDIQDDLFFYYLVNKTKYSYFQILKFKNKYLGIIKL